MTSRGGRRAVAVLCGLLLAVGGCGREEPQSSIPRTAVHMKTPPSSGGAVSEEGNFFAAWPRGCERLVTRTTESETHGRLVAVTCDRLGWENEGAAVRIHYGFPGEDGGPPTPRTVIEMVKAEMANFRVSIMSQQPIRRGPLEGIQVLCQEPEDEGEVWIEGLLLGNDVYVLMAWKGDGSLFDDPEFVRFFASFAVRPPEAGGGEAGQAAAGESS